MFSSSSFLSLFLWIDHFNAVSCCKELELFHRDCLFASEVPSDQVLELTLCEFKPTTFNQRSELFNVDLLSALLLDPVEESFKELVVLSLICELICIVRVEGSHQLTELLFIDSIWLTVHGICAQVVHQAIVESLLSCRVILRVDRP